MSAEVDGACLSRLPCVNSADAAQVDSLENDQYHHEYVPVAPTGDLDRPAAPPVSAVPPTSAKGCSPGTSSSSLHRVADKLKEKLSRQMESEDAATGQNSDAAMSNSNQSPKTKDLTPLQRAQKTSSSEARSQYHSILKLSSPSSKSFGVPSSFSSQNYDFSTGPARFFGHPSDIYPPTVADTLDMLRGMMKGSDAKKDPTGGYNSMRHPTSGKQLVDYCDYDDRLMFNDSKYVFSNNSDDDESFQSETMPDSVSADDFSDAEMNKTSSATAAAATYSRGSRSSSVSSEIRRPLKEEEDDEEEDEDEDDEEARLRNNGADGSVCSDGSFEDKMEAKKARVENIISNMRPSPNSKTTPGSRQATATEAAAATLGVDDGDHHQNGVAVGVAAPVGYGQMTEVRRPKRKQYIPQQHEAREDEMDEPPAKLRKVEKEVIQQELQQMHEQLAEMQQKCLHLLDHEEDQQQQPTAASDRPMALQDFVEGGGAGGRDDRCRNPSKLLNAASDLNRNDLQKIETIHADGKNPTEKANKQFDDHQPTDSNKVASLKHLAKLLKAEITSSVGALVDSIVKNFMAKHAELQKEMAREQPAQPKGSSKTNAFEQVPPPLPQLREPTGGVFKQQRDEPSFMTVTKPPPPVLDASQLAMSRPPCLPPTLLPPHLSLPVHPPFSEHNSLSQSVKQQQQHQQQQRELAEKYIRPYFDLHGKTAFEIPQAHLPLFAPHAFYPPPMAKFQPLFVKEPEQTEALPLVVSTPKKKRTKVTDTRLSPRAARAMLQESLGQHPHHHHHHHQQQQQDHHSHQQQQARAGDRKPFPHHHHHYPTLGGLHEAFPHPSMLSIGLPTSVAIHNPSLQHSDLLQAMYSSQQQAMGHRDGQPGGQGGPPNGPCKRPSSNSSDLANTPNSLMKCDSDAYDQMMSDSMMSYDGHSLISFHYDHDDLAR